MNQQLSMEPLRLDRPLVVFDTETTGTDVNADEIVEIALVRLHPDGQRDVYRSLVRPKDGHIPAEASAIHGITDAMVANAPAFADIAGEILAFLANADLAGYNLLRFDLPVLKRAFDAAGRKWDTQGVRIIDAQVIFHKMEPRDLSAAYRFYCGRELEGAHGALADTEATLEVILGQMRRYPALPRDVSEIDAMFNLPDPRFVDSDRRFKWRDGEPCFNFGTHRSKLLREVADEHPHYIDWILAKDFSAEVKELVTNALKGDIPRREIAITERKDAGDSEDAGKGPAGTAPERAGANRTGGKERPGSVEPAERDDPKLF